MARKTKNIFFSAKKYYKEMLKRVDRDIVIGLNVPLADQYYGLIDHNGNSVFPSETNIKEISSNPDVLALDFVVDAFEELEKDIEHFIQTGAIKRSSFLYKVEPVKGWKSTTEMYHKHMSKVYEAFVGIYLNKISRHSQIENFDDFVMLFMDFVREYVNVFPFSLTKFVTSTKCSKRTSGLVIELLDKPYSDKLNSIEKVLKDPSFDLYQYLIEKHGFKIDFGVPWRLVADIRTSKMRHYMNRPISGNQYLRYGITDIPTLFDIYYYKAYRKDALFLKKYLISFYNHFVDSLPFSKKVCPGKTGVTYDFIARSPLVESDANRIYGNFYWAVLLFKIRLAEEGISLTSAEMKKNIKSMALVVRNGTFEQVAVWIKRNIFTLLS